MSALGHSLPTRLVSASYDVRSTPKADIRFQPNICRDGPCVDGSELARVIFTSAALVGAAMCSAC
jgi:hypothetical protein